MHPWRGLTHVLALELPRLSIYRFAAETACHGNHRWYNEPFAVPLCDRLHLNMHGLIFDWSVYNWQNRPGCGPKDEGSCLKSRVCPASCNHPTPGSAVSNGSVCARTGSESRPHTTTAREGVTWSLLGRALGTSSRQHKSQVSEALGLEIGAWRSLSEAALARVLRLPVVWPCSDHTIEKGLVLHKRGSWAVS